MEFLGISISLPISTIFPSLSTITPFSIVISELTITVALTKTLYGSLTTLTPAFVGKYSFCEKIKRGRKTTNMLKNMFPDVFCFF